MSDCNYVLALNDMRSSNIENLTAVQFFTDRDAAVAWYEEQLNPDGYWKDGHWGKVFRAGGPLEWYNPGDLQDDDAFFGGLYRVPLHVTADEALAARWVKA